jgi:hypothetical protein
MIVETGGYPRPWGTSFVRNQTHRRLGLSTGIYPSEAAPQTIEV